MTSPLQKDIHRFCKNLYDADDDALLTNDIRAFLHYRKKEYAEAVHALLDVDSLRKKRTSLDLERRLDIAIRACIEKGDKQLAIIVIDSISSNKGWLWRPGVLVDPSLRLIEAGWLEEAEKMIDVSDAREGSTYNLIHFVNKCQIRRHQNKKLRKGDIEKLENASTRGPHFKVCCLILRGQHGEVVSHFKDENLEIYRRYNLLRQLINWPIFQLMKDDTRSTLKAIAKELKEEAAST